MELDKDLQARQEARCLLTRATQAQARLQEFSQAQLDAIVEAMAACFESHASELARLAVQETGFGNPEDKTQKNLFACRDVLAAIRPMKSRMS